MPTRDMNWRLLLETRCKYIHVRSNAASMRHTVSSNSLQFMTLRVNRTVVHPCERGSQNSHPDSCLPQTFTEVFLLAVFGTPERSELRLSA
jgi:hypothetical protein